MSAVAQDRPEETPARFMFGKSLGWGIAFSVVIALLGLVWFGLKNAQRGPVVVGDTVPDFTFTTFDGQEISLQDHKGKVVVLNFWASWCKPCEQEAADLEAAWRFYQPGGEVVFLGVGYADTQPEALKYLERFKITYPNGPDLGTRITQAFRIRGVPETYFIDQEGKLAWVKISPFSSQSEIHNVVDSILNK